MYIEMKSLSKTIKGAKVLDGISLKLEGGRVYGLKGKNGSGTVSYTHLTLPTICSV